VGFVLSKLINDEEMIKRDEILLWKSLFDIQQKGGRSRIGKASFL
jgi:hypothetical protein